MDLIANQCGKFADDRGIADIAFLGGQRQAEMVTNEPRNQPGVVAAHSVFEDEGFGIQCTELGMITAAALGDVMKKSGQIGELRCRQ